MIGRVFGAARLVVLCGIAPAVLLSGYVADRYSAHTAMAISAVGYLVLAFAAIASPAIRSEVR